MITNGDCTHAEHKADFSAEVIIPDLLISVTDEEIVFEDLRELDPTSGKATEEPLRRHDLSRSGIAQGWAVIEIIGQARRILESNNKLYSPSRAADPAFFWDGLLIAIDGEPDGSSMVVRGFLDQGADAFIADIQDDEYGLPDSTELEGETDEREVNVAQSLSNHPVLTPGLLSGRLYLVIGGGIGLLVVSIMGVFMLRSGSTEGEGITAAVAEDGGLKNSTSDAVHSEDLQPSALVRENVGNTELKLDPVQVMLPHGYALHADSTNDLIVATGPDRDFRIMLVADTLPQSSVAALYSGIDRKISEEDFFRPVPGLGVDKGPVRTVTYTEAVPDGSSVVWSAWVLGDTVLSVGCQTRDSPTPQQLNVCKMAIGTLSSFSPPKSI